MNLQATIIGLLATLSSLTLNAATFHVSLTGGHVPPFNDWATAATNIQDAVEAATVPGALVLVTNGTYQRGRKKIYGALTNRLAVDKPLLVSSVNGPAAAVIKGNPVIGDSAVRCVYLGKGAALSGFTLTGGASWNSGDAVLEQSGGGVWGEVGVVLTNCLLLSNSVAWYGGGVYGASLYDCVLVGNAAYVGGAACASLLDNCLLGAGSARTGGGAQGCSLRGCALTNNAAGSYGGGASDSLLSRCVLDHNHSGTGGGSVENSTLFNCVLSANSASEGGGGASSFILNNWQEWIAGTTPTDSSSALRLLTPVLPAVTLQWQSTAERVYFIERATGLDGPGSFSLVASNIPGRPGMSAYTDPAPGAGPMFYRVGVNR